MPATPIGNKTARTSYCIQVDGCLITSVELPSKFISAPRMAFPVMINRGSAGRQRRYLRQCLRKRATRRTAGQCRHRWIALAHLARHPRARTRSRFTQYPLTQASNRSPLDGHSYEAFRGHKHIAGLNCRNVPTPFLRSATSWLGVLDALRLEASRSRQHLRGGFRWAAASAWPIYDLTTVEQPLRPWSTGARSVAGSHFRPCNPR